MQKPIFAPENHHGYTWQKTAEHMLSTSVHPWPSPIWGTPGSQDTPRPPDTHTHRLLRLQWSRLTTISLHSSRPVAACFITPDSERSRSRVRFKLELPSAPALGPGLTYVPCVLMSERTLKSAHCQSERAWQRCCYTRVCWFYLFIYFDLIPGKRLPPSERGFTMTSCAHTSF